MNIRQAKKIFNKFNAEQEIYKFSQLKESVKVLSKSINRNKKKVNQNYNTDSTPFIFLETSNTIDEGVR